MAYMWIISLDVEVKVRVMLIKDVETEELEARALGWVDQGNLYDTKHGVS